MCSGLLLRRVSSFRGSLARQRRIRTLVHLVAWCVACASTTGCGSTVATSTGPSPAKCGVTLTAPAASIASSGGTAAVSIGTQAECTWSASSEANWIAGLSPTSGQGAGELQLTVGANPDAAARQGNVVVNGVRAQIRQEAAPCVFDVSSTEQTFTASSGSGRISITTAAGCAWTARADSPWVAISSGASGTGPGSVAFTVAANTGDARSASLVIADRTVRLAQAAALSVECSFTVNPLTTSIAASGGGGSPIAVQVAGGCTWTAVSNAAWLSITSGSSGSGNGSVGFSASANTGAARTGTLTIAGQTVTINQAAASSCTGTVTPTSVSVAAAGIANSSLAVSAPSSCAWTAVSNVTWISIVSGSPDSGNGTVKFTVAANTTTAQRIGTLTVAGQTVTITQAASSSCTYTLNPTTLSIAAAGGAASPVSVSTAGGCAWTATPDVSWLSITSGASGSGNGMVKITVAANTGAARTGTVTVATETITVNQAAPCSFAVSPTSASSGAAGGAGTPITVATTSGCAWTASSGVNWISIASGASGTGSGTVTYSVQTNTGAARMGTLTVAGQTVTISQGAACTYVIAPTSQTIDSPGGTGGPVSVTTQSGCAWTAVSNAPWITVTSGASGTGSGSVSFTVAANGGGQRTGTLTIAGATFTVTELKK